MSYTTISLVAFYATLLTAYLSYGLWKQILFTVIFWLIIFIFYLFIHELAGHYLINLICGIHMDQMMINWDLNFLGPVGISLIDTNVLPPRISYFTGGAVAAVIILSLSLLFYSIYKRKADEHFFILFSIGLGFVCRGLIETFTESFFWTYHISKTNSDILLLVSILVPIVLYFLHQHKHNPKIL